MIFLFFLSTALGLVTHPDVGTGHTIKEMKHCNLCDTIQYKNKVADRIVNYISIL